MQTNDLPDLFPGFNTCQDQVLIEMKRAANAFTRGIFNGGRKRWLSLVGSSGTGKTMLADQIADMSRDKLGLHPRLCCGVIRAYWPSFIEELRDRKFHRMTEAADANLLLLDEVVIEHDPSGYAKDKLCDLLSRRVGKWTILTSNLSLARLGELDTRIPSRMVRDGSKVIDCTTTDYALRNL